jgi:hypothetical protein
MSDLSQGPGWWRASDGKWYPPEAAQPTTSSPPPPNYPYGNAGYPGQQPYVIYGAPGRSPAKSRNRRWIWIVTTAAILLIGAAVAGFLATRSNNNATTAPSDLPPQTTLTDFQSRLQSQLTEARPTGFGVSGVTSVTCNMTQPWQVGKEFKCFVYDNNNNEIGEVDGVIEPTTASGWDANLHWLPSPSYSGDSGSTGNSGGFGNSGSTGNSGTSGNS